MSSVTISLIVLAFLFGGALLGIFLRRVLPQHHLSDDSKDIVRLGIALGRHSRKGRMLPLLLSCLPLLLNGCALRVGPKKVPHERFDYSAAIATSWKEQTLANLVKVRYSDPPVFLDIAQVVTQYTLEASATVNTPDWAGNPSGPAAGVFGRWAESPTITYNLMTGDRFAKSMLEPISPASLLQLVQSGWPIDTVFGVAVKAINGVYASSSAEVFRHQGDPNFYKVLKLLRELQLSDSLGFRVRTQKGGEEHLFLFRPRHPQPEALAAAKALRELLGLSRDATEFHIEFGALPASDTEIAVLTRSILGIFSEAAMGVEVPAPDLDQGRATKPVVPGTSAEVTPQHLVRVQSSAHKPDSKEAFAAIQYHGTWFWIGDTDLASKRGMSFLMILFTLASPGVTITPPALTISRP
jgi:hypothetical protein